MFQIPMSKNMEVVVIKKDDTLQATIGFFDPMGHDKALEMLQKKVSTLVAKSFRIPPEMDNSNTIIFGDKSIKIEHFCVLVYENHNANKMDYVVENNPGGYESVLMVEFSST